MNSINWSKVYKLSPGEFTEDPDKYAKPKLIYSLSDVRKATQKKMRPSPVKGALARFSGRTTIQHYVGDPNCPERKSTASDEFIEGVPFDNFYTILCLKLFNGIGLYLDSNGPDGLPWIMMHLDIRSKGFNDHEPWIWFGVKEYHPILKKMVTKYKYPQKDPKYWRLFNDKRLYLSKQFGIKTS